MSINNVYAATRIRGGTLGALDGIDGDELKAKDAAIVVDGAVYFYSLHVNCQRKEKIPEVVKPDLNAGRKRWILVPFFGVVRSGTEDV